MTYIPAIIQDVKADLLNSSNVNLSGSATPIGGCFTGSAASTLGVAGIQVSLKADKNCTVYVEQSPDGTNWDISDSYIYHYSVAGGFGITIQAINSYVRVLVLNQSTLPTSYFRLQTALCPIVEALPRSLDEHGCLRTSVEHISGYLGSYAEVTPMGDLRVQSPVKLVGTSYIGNVIDNNFWITSSNGSANVTQSLGRVQLWTGAISGSSASLQSNRYGRYSAGTSNYYRGQVRTPDQSGSCIYRWGAFDTSSGYFFQVSSSVFQVGYRNNKIDTIINNGSFNGDDGNIYETNYTNVNTYEIYWTNKSTWYVVEDTMIHKEVGYINPLSDTPTLPVRLEVINTGNNTNPNSLFSRVNSINRLGQLNSNPTFGHFTTAGTYIYKRGAGDLHRLILNNSGGTLITIYDGVGATGNIIAIIDTPPTANPVVLEYKLPFSIGLTIVSTGTWDVTVVYE